VDLSVEQLTEELHSRALDRGRNDTSEFSGALARLIFKYDADLNFDSFKDDRGVQIIDRAGRSVGLYPVAVIDGSIRCERSVYTDVLVLADGPMTLGWITRSEVSEVDPDIFVVGPKSVHQMPTEFDFAQACPHMAVYGGVWLNMDEVWECFGCGEHLVRSR
jgi:hypothetical protein